MKRGRFLLFTQPSVSFMSGDATHSGVNVASGHWHHATKLLSIKALFVAGAAVGRYDRLTHPRSGRRGILLANFVLLGLTAFFGARATGLPTFGLAVLAMGMQNSAITHEASVLVGIMVTGAFVFAQLGAGAFWMPAVASLLLVPLARRLPVVIEKPLVSAT